MEEKKFVITIYMEECTFEEVTHTPEKIYKQLVDPSLLLAREKEKWEDEHEPV